MGKIMLPLLLRRNIAKMGNNRVFLFLQNRFKEEIKVLNYKFRFRVRLAGEMLSYRNPRSLSFPPKCVKVFDPDI